MLYIYGMKNRPFSQGTFPGDGFKGVENLTKRWDLEFWDLEFREMYPDVLVYERELQPEEILDHELDFIGIVL